VSLDQSAPDAAHDLDRLGFGRFRALFAEHAAAGLEPGRVVRTSRGHLWVALASGVVRIGPEGNLPGADRADESAVVGDWVAVRPGTAAAPPVVEALLPRHSCFVRGDAGKAATAQVLAANIDTVFILAALDAGANVRRIERELALAWESGAVPVVVLSKADLIEDREAALEAVRAVAPGVEVILESAKTSEGLAELLAYAAGDSTVALIGPSGAGKSTLVNRLVGGDVQAVSEVRVKDSKGRHTTVSRELVPLPDGGALIDTPGLRAVAMWGEDEGVDMAFTDVTDLAAQCRFDDCTHESEPGCAVLAALEAGALDPDRYAAYKALRAESAFQAQQTDARLKAEGQKRWKKIAKDSRAFFRDGGRG
jgi:ribosome biogenesis GTPase